MWSTEGGRVTWAAMEPAADEAAEAAETADLEASPTKLEPEALIPL